MNQKWKLNIVFYGCVLLFLLLCFLSFHYSAIYNFMSYASWAPFIGIVGWFIKTRIKYYASLPTGWQAVFAIKNDLIPTTIIIGFVLVIYFLEY